MHRDHSDRDVDELRNDQRDELWANETQRECRCAAAGKRSTSSSRLQRRRRPDAGAGPNPEVGKSLLPASPS